MIETHGARVVEISSLVQLRRHLSWAGPWVGALGIVAYVPFSELEVRDAH